MSGIEYADQHRGGSPFPEAWGEVPVQPEARHRWIHRNAVRAMAGATRSPAGHGLTGQRAFELLRARQLEARRADPSRPVSPRGLWLSVLARRHDPEVMV